MAELIFCYIHTYTHTHVHTYIYMKVAQLCRTLCNPMDCKLASLVCPWNSPGKDTGMDSCSLVQAPSWILLPYPRRSPGNRPNPGIKPRSPALLAVWATREDTYINRFLIFFIHSSVSGHLGCFYVLAIVNSAAIYMCLCKSVYLVFWIHTQKWNFWVIR